MKIREIMTPDVQCIGPDEVLVEAAALMRQLDVGALPVCDKDNVIGMITDRDITIRAVAAGRDPSRTCVRDVMSPGIIYVLDEQELDDAIRVMEQHQVRRAPVMTRERVLVGIVSLGDIAVDANMALSAEALKEVSRPAEPVR